MRKSLRLRREHDAAKEHGMILRALAVIPMPSRAERSDIDQAMRHSLIESRYERLLLAQAERSAIKSPEVA